MRMRVSKLVPHSCTPRHGEGVPAARTVSRYQKNGRGPQAIPPGRSRRIRSRVLQAGRRSAKAWAAAASSAASIPAMRICSRAARQCEVTGHSSGNRASTGSRNRPPPGNPAGNNTSIALAREQYYIPPSSPQDNGRHERMHRTMKAETSAPPAGCWQVQQVRFNIFRREYNEERPHEALGQTTPASHWRPPRRGLPSRLQEPWYAADHEVRRVRTDGTIKWRGDLVFIGEALVREPVGIIAHERGGHLVRFCGRDLGMIDGASRFHRFAPPRARLRQAPEPATVEEQ